MHNLRHVPPEWAHGGEMRRPPGPVVEPGRQNDQIRPSAARPRSSNADVAPTDNVAAVNKAHFSDRTAGSCPPNKAARPAAPAPSMRHFPFPPIAHGQRERFFLNSHIRFTNGEHGPACVAGVGKQPDHRRGNSSGPREPDGPPTNQRRKQAALAVRRRMIFKIRLSACNTVATPANNRRHPNRNQDGLGVRNLLRI